MPLKKKLFRSNMLFLFLSMVTLLLIGTAVIGACEDRFERTFEEIGYEKMDGDVWDISKDIGKEGQFWKIRRYGNGMKRQGQIW